MNSEPSRPAIEILTTPSELKSLGTEWNNLADRFKTPLLQHEWFLAAAESYREEPLHIVVARDSERLIGVAPLVLRHQLGIEHYEVLGARDLCEPTGFLYDSPRTFDRLVRAILSEQKPIILTKSLAGPEETKILEGACNDQGYLTIDHASACPWLEMSADWTAFEASMSSGRRSSLRRSRKWLEQQGRMTVESFTGSSPEFAASLEEAFRIEASGWKGHVGSAILSDRGRHTFFTSYALRSAERDMVRLFLMRLNGNGIAMVLAIEYAQRLWILKIGFDEAWSHGSPGILLMHETIRWAFERPLEAYEFLGSDEPWIEMWTKDRHCYTTYRLYPRSLKGIMWLGMEGNRTLMKKAAERRVKVHA